MTREILERRQALIARAAREREQFAAKLDRYRPVAALGDEVIRLGRAVAAHPEWIAAALAITAIARPRLLMRLASRAWIVWRAVRTVRALLDRAVT